MLGASGDVWGRIVVVLLMRYNVYVGVKYLGYKVSLVVELLFSLFLFENNKNALNA